MGVELSSPRNVSGGATTTASESSTELDDASSNELRLLAAGKSSSFRSSESCGGKIRIKLRTA